ncbi:MAG: hypothetical protein CSA75_02520 [Sorangium cellulosum]|nr:MAG: hypothetical protein CSA75_02520 [Sorangium cellulosum]
MPSSAHKLAALCAALLLMVSSCRKQAPKEPASGPNPFAQSEEPKPVQKPVEKKCETLDEPCDVKADTWVEIGEAAQFQPAEGWVYAKQEAVSVAKNKEGAAGIAYRIVSSPLKPKKDTAGVVDALKPVLEALDAQVSEKSIKNQLKESGVIDDKGKLKLATWQLEGKIGGEDGVVIIVVATLDSDKGLVGAVALKKDAVQDNVEAVQKAYRSVRSSQ